MGDGLAGAALILWLGWLLLFLFTALILWTIFVTLRRHSGHKPAWLITSLCAVGIAALYVTKTRAAPPPIQVDITGAPRGWIVFVEDRSANPIPLVGDDVPYLSSPTARINASCNRVIRIRNADIFRTRAVFVSLEGIGTFLGARRRIPNSSYGEIFGFPLGVDPSVDLNAMTDTELIEWIEAPVVCGSARDQ